MIVKSVQILSSFPDFEIIFFCPSHLTHNTGAAKAGAQEVLQRFALQKKVQLSLDF